MKLGYLPKLCIRKIYLEVFAKYQLYFFYLKALKLNSKYTSLRICLNLNYLYFFKVAKVNLSLLNAILYL